MQDTADFPQTLDWYDSVWLHHYFGSKEIIARVAPSRLRDFEAAMAVFRTDPAYEVKYITGFLDAAKLAEMREVVAAIPREKLELHEVKKFGRLIVHDWPEFTRMQHEIVDFVSELAGEPVEPRYNFLSLYSRRGICEPHLDTPSAKWTFDLCLDQSDPWPISFTSIIDWPDSAEELVEDWRSVRDRRSSHKVSTRSLEPGDALLFSGSSQWHWRDQIPASQGRSFCDLLFFHFIPAGTARLVQPRYWAEIFGVPELAEFNNMSKNI